VEKEDEDKAKNAQIEALPTEMQHAEEKSFLKPPSQNVALPWIHVKSDFQKPQKVELPDGLVLTIPADAFETETGAPVEGEVEVVVRAASEPADLIAMGLPMQSDLQVLNPLLVLDIHATANGNPVQLKEGASIVVEQELAPNFARPQTVYTLDVNQRKWIGGENEFFKPAVRKEGRAAMPQDDGFGVVQYDENGQVIPQKQPQQKGEKEIKVLQFTLSSLGISCLGESAGATKGLMNYKVRFADAQGQALRLLTLYSLPKGLNTVQFYFPKTADYVFEAGMMAGTTTTFAGFLPDGRLALVKGVGALPETMPVHTLKMEISPAPIKDLQELTQLLAGDVGQ
jgi:hypothetical protein